MKKITLLLLSALAFLRLNAQKLPNVQQASLRAPANVKVDGKPTEWSSMQAYNPSAEISYTIANDDKKLYLVVQAKDRDMMLRLINGGVTFLVQRSGKKSDAGAVGIKFPFIEKGQNVGLAAFTPETENGKSLAGTTSDAIVASNNKRISAKVKWIYTKGLLGKDSVMSLYNEVGIQAANAIDLKRVYTSEMAIDLSLLGLSSGSKFTYHIIINGEPNRYVTEVDVSKYHAVSRDGSPVSAAQLEEGRQKIQASFAASSSTSDFWGEYTLAK